MATAEKLLLEAEYAFRNISPGSADEKKFTAQANRHAAKLVRKYPASREAERAHNILRHLGAGYAAAKPRSEIISRSRSKQPKSRSPHADHTSEAPHRHQLKTPKPTTGDSLAIAEVRDKSRNKRNGSSDSWESIWQTFLGLSYAKKKILAFVALFVAVIIGFTPFLLLFFLYYAVRPAAISRHVRKVVNYFA